MKLLAAVFVLVLALALGGAAAAQVAAPRDVGPMCPIDPETGECMSDGDRDGLADVNDNCPDVWNPYQEDNDHDGIGNACDATPDGDGGGGGGGGGGGSGGGGGGGTSCSAAAILYEHVSYGGLCWGFSGQVPYVGDAATNQASSIQVASGFVATLFADANFQGASVTTRTTADPWGWGAIGNDDVSSLVVQSDEPSSTYSDGSWLADEYYSTQSLPPDGCSGVSDSVKWTNAVRTHWKYTLKTRFCWQGDRITSVYAREIVPEITPIPFPFNFVQTWAYAAVDFQQGEAGFASTVLRSQARFDFCTLKFGCLLTKQPWIRIELFQSGRATCTTIWRQDPHPCVRFS